jgi:sugar phosphate permease
MLWLPFYLQDSLGLEPASAAYVSTMFDIGGGIGSPLCGIVADKLCRTCRLLGTSCAPHAHFPRPLLLFSMKHVAMTVHQSRLIPHTVDTGTLVVGFAALQVGAACLWRPSCVQLLRCASACFPC